MGLVEVSGYYTHLQRGFAALGVDASLVTLEDHPYAYEERSRHRVVRFARWATRRRGAVSRKKPLRKMAAVLLHLAARGALLAWAIARFDVFIFGYASTFFSYAELPLLKLLKKRVIYMFHGSDSRPPYIDGAALADMPAVSTAEIIAITARRKKIIAKIERYADVIVSYPLHSHLHARPLVFSTLVGFPIDYEASAARPATPGVTILHAPSARASKGSPEIRRVIGELVQQGYPIRFVEVWNRPHAEVMTEMAGADFAIDQLYSDAPCSGFAAEAASLGKPVVIGGYAWEAILQAYPADTIPPAEYCRPEELCSLVRRLIDDEGFRRRSGERARAYYQRHWGARNVAEKFLRLATGDVPAEWLFDPSAIRYVHGYGLPLDRARESVRRVLAAGGSRALQVHDKPELERRFEDFAAGAAE